MDNEYIDLMNDLKTSPLKSRDYNRYLCTKYPWLIPTNLWTGKEIENFDYTWTELDYVPDGWYIAFGEQMCSEIAEVLAKTKDKNFKYQIIQIKEKFGELRWYDNGAPEDIYDELTNIIEKYTELSKKTCIFCGKPATQISTGWVVPWCDDCVKQNKHAGDNYYFKPLVNFKNIQNGEDNGI